MNKKIIPNQTETLTLHTSYPSLEAKCMTKSFDSYVALTRHPPSSQTDGRKKRSDRQAKPYIPLFHGG